MNTIRVVESINESEFIRDYIKTNTPVIIKDVNFDETAWTPDVFRERLGDLQAQVYDTLFDLQEVTTLSNYLDTNFGHNEFRNNVPYVRWYNRLKDIEHAWGDEAFSRLSSFWKKPSFLPGRNLLIPPTNGCDLNPVTDTFPYRGILIAAKGARTRLHRDPFCSDAIVSQFYGKKNFVMYRPDRASELRDTSPDSSSFGGFIDVRPRYDKACHPKPDFQGVAGPGDVVYVPHGWLHDVLVLEDSLSVTWNFIHEMGALEYIDYLMDDPCVDSEFEVLNYFYKKCGDKFDSPNDIIQKYNQKFVEIEDMLAT